jgi:hypothetical protein
MSSNKYDTKIRDKYDVTKEPVTIDVYQVLDAYGVANSAMAHLVKKALCCGHRGHKDVLEDCKDIIDSALRARQLETQHEYVRMMNEQDKIRNL